MRSMIKSGVLFAMTGSLLVGCSVLENVNNTQKGTAIGVASGAAIGGIIGNNVGKGNSVIGAIIGAAVGGVVGNRIGNRMDHQAELIKESVPGLDVVRVGEGINVTFNENSGVKFKSNSDRIEPQGLETLKKMAEVFKEYDKTNILVEGHTDSTGSDSYNMELSKKRAISVVNYLVAQGVDRSRFTIKWYGESQPKFGNDTEEGRFKNRRVELGIVAGEGMIEEAKK